MHVGVGAEPAPARCGPGDAMNKFPGLLAALLLSASALKADTASGYEFLLSEPAARSAGMGGAEASTDGRLESLIYNPAGLAGMSGLQIALSNMSGEGDWNDEWVAVGDNFGSVFVGGQVLVSSLASFTLYNASGQAFDTAQVGSQAISLAAAQSMASWLHVGADLRYFRSELYTYTSQGFALDAGLQLRGPNWPLSVGFAVQNAGLASAYYQDSDPLPTLFRGVQAPFDLNNNLRVTPRADMVRYEDTTQPAEFRLGVEGVLYKQAFVRAGWIHSTGYDQPSLGVGVIWQSLAVDYAYEPGSVLGSNQLIELRIGGR